MVALLIGVSVAVAGLCWAGHKASVRIAEWGRNMNACDEIFRTASELTGGELTPAVERVSAVTPRRKREIPIGVAKHV
jgi:hypothetical protein